MTVPRSRGSQIYLVQLAAVVVGIMLVLLGPWRAGMAIVGGAFVLGALARVAVPPDHTGMLRVRGKAFDVVWMTTLGASLVLLSIVVPPQPV